MGKKIIGILLENHRWYDQLKEVLKEYHLEEFRIEDMDHPYMRVSVDEKCEFWISIGYGSAIAASCMEEFRYLGATMGIRIGTTGAIRSDVSKGDIVIALAAVRDEGVSKFYLEDGVPAMSSFSMCNSISSYLNKNGLRNKIGIVYTTDGRWKENREKMSKLAKCGVISVEMETAAILAVGMDRQFPIMSLSIVSDSPTNETSDFVGDITQDVWNGIVIPKFYELLPHVISWGSDLKTENISFV